MAIIRKKELNTLAPTALSAKLLEVRRELNTERGLIKSGGRSSNPGKLKELRRTIARILTKLSQKASLMPAKKTGTNARAPAPVKSAGPESKKNEVKISA